MGCFERQFTPATANVRLSERWMGSTVLAFGDERADAKPLSAKLHGRLIQRRQMLIVQAAAYVLGDIIVWIYAYAGTVPITIPCMFLICGMGITGVFAALSECSVGDRFDDHFLSAAQASANIIMQLGFLVAAPEIGFLCLTVVFVIFGFAALRITARQAAILWAITGVGVGGIFGFLDTPVTVPMVTPLEWLAATCSFLLTIGQCAYVGHFGNSMRKSLHQRTVELRIANQRIEELAQLDELTGLLNRRYIMQCLTEEITRAQRTDVPCSIALIDLDHFKRINDRFGHLAGDEVLRTFAISLFANIRTIDKLGRYGGEEFLLILPDCSKDQAVGALDRLGSIISEVDWTAISGTMCVTMSAGICAVRQEDSAADILARADVALYRAKGAGRNRVIAA